MDKVIYTAKGKDTNINKDIPEKSGVYILMSKEEILYIGATKNLQKRIAGHFSDSIVSVKLVNSEDIDKVILIFTSDRFEALRIEEQLLNLIPTKNNSDWYGSNLRRISEELENEVIGELIEDDD